MKLGEVREFLKEVAEGCPQELRERRGRPVLAAMNLRIAANVLEGVSTDSYILVHRSMPASAPDMGWTLFNAEQLVKAFRWFPKDTKATIEFLATGITIQSDFVSITVPPTEGAFPNWEKLRPKGDGESVLTIALNATFGARIQKAFRGENLRLTFYGENSPMLVRPASPLLGASSSGLDAEQWAIWMPIRMPPR